MAVDEQVKVLEDEFKLIKSELRQTLVSVRDFLLDLKLPPMPEEEALLQELPVATNNKEADSGNQGNQNGSGQTGTGGDGSSGTGADSDISEPVRQQEEEPELQPAVEETPVEEDDSNMELEELGDSDDEDNGMTSGDIPSEEGLEEEEKQTEVMAQMDKKDNLPKIVSSESQINLLANLIRWVNTAKTEIGFEQLVAFLDVYAIGGYLTEDIKGVILHLAQVATDTHPDSQISENNPYMSEQISLCMEINSLSGQLPDSLRKSIRRLTEILIQQTVQKNRADIWSKLLLELHGILNGNASALQALINKEKEEQKQKEEQVELEKSEKLKAEEAKKKNKPARLRLVLPGNDGNDQELDLGNLFIATDLENNEGDGQRKLSFS
jgi:hypothetical protein